MKENIFVFYENKEQLAKLRRLMSHTLLYDQCIFSNNYLNIINDFKVIIINECNFNKLGELKIQLREVTSLPIINITLKSNMKLLKLLQDNSFIVLKESRDYKNLRLLITSFQKNDIQNIHITKKEKEILYLLQEGFSSTLISETLSISTKTLATHKRNLFIKTGVHSITQLTLWSINNSK